ncbi:MAG: TIGR01777 family oxidoreductase [Candidatus Eremiobacteraeota bacterium]|nr:TIGR01777 family oxidoreductase [Candidatus Eremiobacteraeota bacterium]
MNRVVAVIGASGFVGRHVVEALRARGARVIAFSRDPQGAAFAPEIEVRRFDAQACVTNPHDFEAVDAVINLAGEPILGRWAPEKKRRIAQSRIEGTRSLIATLRATSARPKVLVSASAVGYYGDRGDESLTERSSAGDGFLADVCRQWEAAAAEAEHLGIRCVQLRTGIVLGPGGALPKMQAPFQWGVGGPLGTGRQFVPWIHIDDLAALYVFALEREGLSGPVNAVTPDYCTNARLAQAIGAAVARPALLPAPSAALYAFLGEFAGTLLGNQLVIPAAAEDAGFTWSHPNVESAIATLAGSRAHPSGIATFTASQFVPRPLEEVFRFFSDARNLEAITPPNLSFHIRQAPERVERGSIVDYTLRLHGFPIRWKTLIAEYHPMRGFVDVQLRGPYALWRHAHTFLPVDGGVQVLDSIDYSLPLAPFGNVAAGLVARDVRAIFDFRRAAISQLFGEQRKHDPPSEPRDSVGEMRGRARARPPAPRDSFP